MINTRALLLDSSFLLEYVRGSWVSPAQVFVSEAVLENRILVIPAVSLAVAAAELGGPLDDLRWLVDDPEGPISVLPLSLNALDVGALAASAGGPGAPDLGFAQVVQEALDIRALVVTYAAKDYVGQSIDVIDMRRHQ